MKKSISLFIGMLLLVTLFFTGCPGTENPSGTTVSDADLVAAAKTALTIGFVSGDTAEKVREDVTLATAGASSVKITWSSSVASVISTTGTVTRGLKNTDVALTATISKGDASDTKVFTVVVYGTNQEKVDSTLENLSIPTLVNTNSITLPTSDTNGVSISWVSSNTAIISTNGTVTKASGSGKDEVTLTATIAIGTEQNKVTATKEFTVTVPQADYTPSDAEYVAAAIDSLVITYESGDSAERVTKDITLLTLDSNGVSISWASDKEYGIAVSTTVGTGDVKQNIQNIPVTLTATATKGSATATKTFNLTVTKINSIISEDDSYSQGYTFTDSKIEYVYHNKSESYYRGTQYTIKSIDMEQGTVTCDVAAIASDEEPLEWLSKSEYITYGKGMYKAQVTLPKDLANAQTLSSALSAIRTFATMRDPSMEDATEAELIKFALGDEFYPSYSSMTDAQKLEAMKEFANGMRLLAAEQFNLDENSTWEQIEAEVEAQFQGQANYAFAENLKFKYEIDEYNGSLYFDAKALYNSEKPWYLQNGSYDFYASENYTSVSLYLYSNNSGRLYISGNDSSLRGTFNATYTTFTTSDKTVWNLSFNTSTEKLTISSDSTSYELSFSGSSMQ